MNAFIKQPSEKIPVTMDFTNTMDGTEAISTTSVKAYEYDSETDVSATLIGSSSTSGSTVISVVQAGTNQNKYKITFKITTDSGNIYEEDVFMRVIER